MTVERILELGAECDWPAVRLERAEILHAGERAWRRYLATLRADQHERLVAALCCGWATTAGERGMVRE